MATKETKTDKSSVLTDKEAFDRDEAAREKLKHMGDKSADGQATTSSGVTATDETTDLIASNKVEGTAVYNTQGQRLGTVHNFMVNKRSGQVAYAVMSFGGFLGIGESYHPLPWKTLTYDPSLSGYVVDISRERLQGAPSYTSSDVPDWSNRTYGRRVSDYWGGSSGGL